MDRLLNRTVEVQRRTAGVDQYGNEAGGYETVATIRARIEDSAGAEDVKDQEATQENARMWTRSDVVQHSDRIVDGPDTWEVEGVPLRREAVERLKHFEASLRRWKP